MIEQIRAYLAANYPASIEGENHKLDKDGNIIAWGFSEFGPPPTQEQMLAVPPLKQVVRSRLDPDEAARKELLREMRASAMAALIANGWSSDQAQDAGRQFIRDYGVDIWVYEFGADRGFFAAASSDKREWLDLPWPGNPGKTIRHIFTEALD